ncbi:MAG: hypothetical protein R3F39_22970, partial [Myxococcota bacterium]
MMLPCVKLRGALAARLGPRLGLALGLALGAAAFGSLGCRDGAASAPTAPAEDPSTRIASVRALVEAGDGREAVARAEVLVAGWPKSADAQLVLAS